MTDGLRRYQLERELGRGTFGEVYQARDLDLKRPVALKRSLPQQGDDVGEQARSFKAEAEILSKLRHPNICTLFDYFVHGDGSTYLVMEYIPGESLEDLLRRQGSLPDETLRPMMVQLAQALQYLHANQPSIVHRDLKPANVRLTPDGAIKLVDFGIARAKVKGTQDTTLIGTPGFMPGEQRLGQSQPASDVYAWACTYLNLLTGLDPVESCPPYNERILAHHIQDSALLSLLTSCTAAAPEARPSATQVLQALGAAPASASNKAPVAAPRSTSGCPFCSHAEPEIFGCCAKCDLSANLEGCAASLWVARGEDLVRRNRPREAAAHFDKAIQSGWRHPDAFVSLARCYTLTGRSGEALAVLSKLGESPQVSLEKARALNSAGKKAEALAMLGSIQSLEANLLHVALEARPDAMQKLQALKKRHGGESSVIVLEARILQQQGQVADALGLLEQAYVRTADPLLQRHAMRISFAAGRFEECVIAIHKLQKQFPDDPDALLTQARIHAAKGRVAEAREGFLSYLAMRPAEHKARIELAKLLDIGGFPREAIVEYEVLHKEPSYRDRVDPLLGLALHRIGEHAKALPFLNRAVERERSSDLCARFALSLLETGRQSEARKWAERALSLDRSCVLAEEILRRLSGR